MSIVPFDTLALARKLRDDAKMTSEQAEGIARALAEAMSGADVATRSDLAALATRTELKDVQTALKAEIAEAKAELKADIGEVKAEIGEVKAEIGRVDLRLSGRMDRLEERIERRAAETEVRLIRWLVSVGIAAVLALGSTIVGAAWAVIRYMPAMPPHP